MLQLSLRPGEYLTIHGDIVVQLAQLSGSRAFLRVEADRSIPIVRGKVLERSGAPRPECLASLPRSRARKGRDAVYHWNGARKRAIRAMEQILDQMESDGPWRRSRPCGYSWSSCSPPSRRKSCPVRSRPCFGIKRPGTHNAIHSVWFHPVPRTG